MYALNYHCPKTLAEAKSLLAASGDGQVLAGGQTLIPTLKQRLAQPDDLIDISRLEELRFIRQEGDTLHIGAGMTHAEIMQAAEVQQACPALAELAGGIGDPHVRHKGTLGGSLANNDPAADYPAACLALDAVLTTSSREIKAEDFFTGLFSTALEDGEIILSVAFPRAQDAAYAKFPQPASRYALTGVFAVRAADGKAKLAVTGAGNDGVFRFRAGEEKLSSRWHPDALNGVLPDETMMAADIHAGQAYRAQLVNVMARQAIAKMG